MKCTRCHGSGKEPESGLVTGWFQAHVKPARPGIYQKHVDGYIRYATFTGRRWGPWVESIETAIHPSYQYEHTDADHPWRGLKTPNAQVRGCPPHEPEKE